MPDPTMVPVESSNIESIGYDQPGRTLHVKFKGSGLYKFGGVSEAEHKLLMAAPSKGKHFRQHIQGKYHPVKAEIAKAPRSA